MDFPQHLDRAFALLFDGSLGVRFFFCISGFLITWLLAAERQQSGSINLSSFYIRRSLRILPVYFVFLLALSLLTLVTPWHQSAREWIGNLTFTTNYLGGVRPSGHLWSLAVEEQFYLLWPAFLALVYRRTRTDRAIIIFLGALMTMAPISRVIGYTKVHPQSATWLFQPNSFICCGDSLAIGAAAALLFTAHPVPIKHWMSSRRYLTPSIAVLLISVPYVAGKFNRIGILTVPFADSCESLGFILLLVQSIVLPAALPYSILNHAALRWIGTLSFSLYIWQHIFCTQPRLFGLVHPIWMAYPYWILTALLAATVSYYLLEKPLLSLRAKYR